MAPPKLTRAPRAVSKRNPLLQGRERGVWHADLVGKIHAYPKTQESYTQKQERQRAAMKGHIAEGKLTRKGVPDGWAGRKQELITIRENAAAEAKEIVATMVEKGLLDAADDEALGNEAIQHAIAIVRAQDEEGKFAHTVRDRISALAIVAKFTKATPVQKTAITLNKAEDFLAVLASEAAAKRM